MATDRARRRLIGALATGLGVVACRAALGQPAERAVYAGIETDARGRSTASFFAASGARTGHVALDFRAHGLARHGGRVVVFPRRPGDRFAVIDEATLDILSVVAAPAGRHFFGHGAFTTDGATLLVTENDLDTLRGAIGLYELPSLRRLGRVDLPGPGPHEIVRHPSRDRFFIALGGLETHPAYGRTPLNLGTFRSQILVLDLPGGALTPCGHWPGSEGVSLRHLAMDGTGRLYIGGQVADERRAGADAGLVWLVEGDTVTALPFGPALGGYVSSVAAGPAGATLTSKETGAVLHLDGATLTGRDRLDGAGAAAHVGPDPVVSGFVDLSLGAVARQGTEFDNHGLALG